MAETIYFFYRRMRYTSQTSQLIERADELRRLWGDSWRSPVWVVEAVAGYARRTIQRAANVLKIDRRKDGMKGGWTWRLAPEGAKPPPEDTEDANKKSLAPTASSAPSLASSTVVEVEL